MKRVALLTFVCLILNSGCGDSAEPLHWPGFDAKVIEVGRQSLQARLDDMQAIRAPSDSPTEPLAATSEAVLRAIKTYVDRRGPEAGPAFQSILQLGADAIDPLIDILADDSLSARYRDRAAGILIPGMREGTDTPYTLDLPVLMEARERVFDALANYLQHVSEAQINLAELKRITPPGRIPRLIELIENSTGDNQTALLNTFAALTYADFATHRPMFCGHTDAETVRQAQDAWKGRQQELATTVRAWWEDHKHESLDDRLAAALKAGIAARREQIESLRASMQDSDTDHRRLVSTIRDYPAGNDRIWRPSAFSVLVDQYGRVPNHVQPYVLRLIGSSSHPEAAAFVAPKLNSRDPHIQFAAIAALMDLKTSGYNEQISRILRNTEDEEVARQAVEALEALAGSQAIEDFVVALADPESDAAVYARRALQPYLESHREQIARSADALPSIAGRRIIENMLAGSAAAHVSQFGDQVAAIRGLLRSRDPDRQKSGIRLAGGFLPTGGVSYANAPPPGSPEVIPDVLELITSTDWQVRSEAVELVQKFGVPKLTVANASRLLGYSNQLDRHVAAFCYAKYGREAVPILQEVAFCVQDAQYSQRAPGSPAVGLIRALLKEEVAGTAEDVVRLVKDSRCNSTYLALLQLLDDPESAKLLGELLRHEQTHYRREAIRIIGARGLQQYAGALLEIATAPVDPNEKTRLLAEYEKGKVSKAEFENRMRILQSEPQERRAATLALIEMNDRNAWQVVRAFLETEYLEHGQYGTTEYYLHSPIGFGLSVAKLKPSRGEEMRALLAEEISGQKRDCVIDLLTTALCVEPDPADVEPLWTVASTADMREPTRVLAAVALARLGERRVVPVLHEWVRKYTAPGPGGAPAPGFPGGVFTVLSSSMQRWMNRRWESLLDSTVTGPPMSSPKFEPDQADIGLALRRLGDETLVPELVQSLGTSRGDFNMTAYRFLAGITGVRAYDQARNWMEAHDCVSRQTTAALIGVLQGLGVSESELLPLIAAGEGSSRRTVFTLTTCDSPAAADAVVAAYRDLSGYAKMNKVEMVESLCRSGDPRGLALAAEDPLLFASVVKYVPEADPVDFPAGHFEYNRIEEAMRVQAWYRQHADALKWDADSGTFRLAAGEK